jgi:hypothetical protein
MMGAGGGSGRGAAAPAAQVSDAAGFRFESAKAASAQRSASNIAVVDSLSFAAGHVSRDKDEARTTRRIDGRTLSLRDGAWTDVRYHAGMPVTSVKPYSKAYFDILKQLPELKSVFALGDRVVVVGKSAVIRVDDSGMNDLAPAALTALVHAW